MAGLLVLRLCQDDSIDESLHIATNDFVEALFSVAGGYYTATQLKTFYNMTAPEQAEMDAIIAQLVTAPDLASKMGRIHRIRSILTFYERADVLVLPSYDSPDDVELHLSELDTGFN